MNRLLLVALLTVAVSLVRASTAAGDCPLITAGATCIAHADTCLWCPSVQRCSLKCSLRPDNTTCNSDTLCVWAAPKGQCVDSCVTQYETAQDCSLGGTTCEWNSDQSICQQNCSAIVDMSICNVVTTCRWSVNRSSCLSNVGTFAIENSVFAAEMNSTTVRPALIASMRKDLVDLYSNYRNGTIAVIADRISVNATTTRIPFTAPSFYIPWEAWWCIDTNGTWLSDTWSTYTTHGGAGASSVALVVTSFSVSSSVMETDPPSPVPSSSTAPPRSLSHDSMDLSTCVIPAVICSIVAVLAIGTVIGIRWRHNPYAAIHRSPTAGGVTVQRFSQFDHERFRHVDGRVVTRDAAGAKKQRWDATSSVFAAQSQTWPDAAFLDVPRNTQRRVDLRSACDELTGPLLPAVVETLTDIRVVVEQGEGIVKCDPRLRLMLFRYSNTVRLLAKSDGVECLLVGQPRCLVTSRNGDVLPADPEHKFVEGKRDVNVVKAAFEGSGHCSHVGTNEERKVVFARLVAQDEPSVVLVSEMHTAVERQLGSAVLHGLPSTWPPAFVQSAVRLMLKLAPVLLVDEGGRFAPNMDELVTVQALNPLDGGLAQSYGGSWRVRCLSRDTTVLRVLSTLANRFWALPVDGSGGTSDHILYCQCASGGVTFNPLVGRLVGGVRATTPLDDPAHRLLFLSDRSSPDSADSLLLQPAPGQHHQHAASAAGGSLHPSEDDWTASMLLSRTAAAVGSALLL